MLNKKISLSILLFSLLLIINFIGFIPIYASEKNQNNEYSSMVEELNDALLLDNREILNKYIESSSSKNLLMMNHGEKEKLIQELSLINVHKLDDSFDLFKIQKRYDAKTTIDYVFYNKDLMKLSSFENNIKVFMDLYENNNIKDVDLVVDVYTYLLSIKETEYAKKMMVNPKDINIIYDGQNSEINYSFREKYDINNSNNFLYSYYASSNSVNGIYKYLAVVYKNNNYKIEVNNTSSYLYILKDKIENGRLNELFTFIYLLNYGKETDLKMNNIFSKLDKKIKEDMMKNKGTIYYLTSYKIQSNGINFDLKVLPIVEMETSYKNLFFDKKTNIDNGLSSVESEEQEISNENEGSLVSFFFTILLIVGITFAILGFIYSQGSNTPIVSEPITSPNERHRSIHENINRVRENEQVRYLSRERSVNFNQLMENRDSIQRSIEQRRNSYNEYRDSIRPEPVNLNGSRNSSYRESNEYMNEEDDLFNDFGIYDDDYSDIDGMFREISPDVLRQENLNRIRNNNLIVTENRQRQQSQQIEDILSTVSDEMSENKDSNNLDKETKRTISIEEDSVKKEELKLDTKRKIYFEEE